MIDQETARALVRVALEQAALAASRDEVPVGAVVARLAGDEILAAAHDEKMSRNDPTAHAEVLAIRRAAEKIGDWRLENCVLAVTLEPCAMCAGTALLARIPLLVYGAESPKFGAVSSRVALLDAPGWNHRVEVMRGVLADDCARILEDYFRNRRAARG